MMLCLKADNEAETREAAMRRTMRRSCRCPCGCVKGYKELLCHIPCLSDTIPPFPDDFRRFPTSFITLSDPDLTCRTPIIIPNVRFPDTCPISFPFAYFTCFSHSTFHIMSRAPPQFIPAHLGSVIIISSLRLTALFGISHYPVIFIIPASPLSCI